MISSVTGGEIKSKNKKVETGFKFLFAGFINRDSRRKKSCLIFPELMLKLQSRSGHKNHAEVTIKQIQHYWNLGKFCGQRHPFAVFLFRYKHCSQLAYICSFVHSCTLWSKLFVSTNLQLTNCERTGCVRSKQNNHSQLYCCHEEKNVFSWVLLFHKINLICKNEINESDLKDDNSCVPLIPGQWRMMFNKYTKHLETQITFLGG